MACLVGPRSRRTEARGARVGHEGEVRGASQLEHCSADFLVSLGKGAAGADTLLLEAVPGSKSKVVWKLEGRECAAGCFIDIVQETWQQPTVHVEHVRLP